MAARRRVAITAAAALGIVLLSFTGVPSTKLNTPAARAAGVAAPNIVIVVTDDQRVRSMSSSRTPKLWSMIRAQGALYSEAAVPTSLCCPSRATILTGRFAHSTRVFSNQLPYGGWQLFHDAGLEQLTIADALHDAGYHTALVGKYLNGPFPTALRNGYLPPGWDQVVSFTSGMGYYGYSLNDGRYYGSDPSDYSTDVLAAHAERVIRTAPADQPLFLYFAPVSPHRPFTPAPRHVGRWEGKLPSYHPMSVTEDVSDKPPWVRSRPRTPQRTIDADLAASADTLMSVDDAVGGIVDALSDTGRMRDTLFIYLSDNGLLLGEHHLITWKDLPYRWATRIPLLVRWDGHVPAGSTDARLALNVDVAATVSAAAGLGMRTQGLDLLGSAQRSGYPLEAARWFPVDSLPKHPAYCGYATRRWMFAQYANGVRELYDYRSDPGELHNLGYVPEFAAQVRLMRGLAKAACTPVPPDFHW